MAKAIIKITFKHTIDASAGTPFEKNVFQASYQEFLMKSQAYNLEGKFKTFTQMKENDGRANSLHYKLSFSVLHFVESLKNRIPNLQDTNGNNLTFEKPEFKLEKSDITNQYAHRLAIYFTTDDLTLHAVIGDYLLLSKGAQALQNPADIVETFMVKVQLGLNITSYQEIDHFEILN